MSRTSVPGWETGTTGVSQPGQINIFIVVIQARKTSTTEEKHYKNAIKERARTYKHKGARNIENRAIVEKTQLSKDLYYSRKENYKLDLFYL